jgi:putative tricarboxylic transport membrane protein
VDTSDPKTDTDSDPLLVEKTPRPGRAHHVGALVPFALGSVWVGFANASFSLGDLREPGPALWPTMVGGFLAAMSVILWLTERDDTEYEPFVKKSKFVALGAISTAVFIVIYENLGFLVGGFLLMLFWCRYLGRESWRLSLVVSAATAVLGYLVFGELLGVPLPDPLF